MADIFICYRHSDSAGYVGHLADDLERHFPGSRIFRDLESLHPGVPFRDAIEQALNSCVALLAVIGPRWLDAKERMDDPDDYIRLEIGTALERDILVVPVLVGGAEVPTTDDLPAALDELAGRQVHEITDKRWDYDVRMLTDELEKLPGLSGAAPPSGLGARLRAGARGLMRWRFVPLALILLVVALALFTRAVTGGTDPRLDPALGVLDVDLTRGEGHEGNCIKPPDCESQIRAGERLSEDLRLLGADVRYDPEGNRLHLLLSVSWVLREGRTNLVHRGYIGKLYYVASYSRTPDGSRVAVSGLEYRDDTLAPYNGLLAYTFGWLEIPFLKDRDTRLTEEVRRRLNEAPEMLGLP